MTRARALRALAALACAPLVASCATLGSARPWGEPATLAPGKRTLARAVVNAVKAPQTWAPLAAAAVLQIDRLDARAARWTSGHTPVFGSRAAAERAGNRLANAAAIASTVSIVAAPSGTDPVQWTLNKAKGGALDLAAFASAQGIAAGIKASVGRRRPDGSDERSFPSGHATRSSVSATVAARNARAALGEGRAARAAELGTFALAAACGWSRVEAGAHYPADALAGFALGHLVGAIVSDGFVTPAAPVALEVSIVPGRGGAVAVSWRPRR